MKLDVVYDDQTVVTLAPKATLNPRLVRIPAGLGDLLQVRHDFQVLDGLIRVGMPSVLSMYLNKFTELTEDWQWFWFRQMVHSFTDYQHWDINRLSPADQRYLKNAWAKLIMGSRAFTNDGAGTKTYYDAINRLNTGFPNPKQEPLTCTGNIHRVIGDPVRLAGEMCLPVETLNGLKPPPDIAMVNRLTRPDLIPDATNVAANKPANDPSTWTLKFLPDGTWRIDPFPQMQPKSTPFALRTNGNEAEQQKALFKEKGVNAIAGTYSRDGVQYAVNYIRMNRLMKFTGEFVPNPYNPPQ